LQHTLFAVTAILTLATGCRDARPTVVLNPENGGEVPVRVEVADTPQTRSLGLMYRTNLTEDQGMIFLFEKEDDHQFWMKNTPLSLDMIFISGDGRIVGIQKNTEPFSMRPLGPGAPSRAVLEVRGGFSDKHGLKAGDRVTYKGIQSNLLAP
jgi:hypothetical protein